MMMMRFLMECTPNKHVLLLLTSGEYMATLRDHNASFVKACFDTFDLNQEITAPMN